MIETSSAKRARAGKIVRRLARAYPAATIALRFENPLQLLVATILAAQCTDERVNQVTEHLFPKYRTAADYARASATAFEIEIRPTGFFRAKTRAILAMARALIAQHRGEVPDSVKELTALPGVGRKTANVVRGNAFGIPAIAVDTHVFRVSQRLGLARSGDPDKIEAQLAAVIAPAAWTRVCHLLQAHGRQVCLARSPACSRCPVWELCTWPDKTPAVEAPGAGRRARRPPPRAAGIRAAAGRRGPRGPTRSPGHRKG